MYDYIGSKIQVIGKLLGWLLLVAGVITWIILITNGYTSYYGNFDYITEDDILGWTALVSGIVGFISSWMVIGFGVLIEEVGVIRYELIEVRKAQIKAEKINNEK